jgi:hypothetical protein
MKPRPHILTFSFLLLLPSCSKEAVDVGSMDGPDGSPSTDASPADGTTASSALPTGGNGGVGAVGGAGGQASATTSAFACTASANGLATDGSNYNYASALSMPAIKVKPQTDLTFDWSDVKADIRGATVNPATDVQSIWVVLFNLSQKGLQNKVSSDSLGPSDVVSTLVYRPESGTSSAKVSQFTVNGAAIPAATIISSFDSSLFPPDNYTYAVFVSKNAALGWGGLATLMIQTFQLDGQSSNTAVPVTSTSTALSFLADLRSLRPLPFVAGQPGTVDWSTLKNTAAGTPFDPSRIADVVVAHYTQTLPELEAVFPRLESIAVDLYQGPSGGGTSADLATLTDARGVPFAGIDGTGTWLFALRCDDCMNPSPPYLTILEPCDKDRVNDPTNLGASCQLDYASRAQGTFRLDAPECANGLCLKPIAAESTTDAFDTGPYCTRGCTQDSDCDGHIRNPTDPNDKGCRLGYACGIAFVKGPLCCRSMCMCKDFTDGAAPTVPVGCQGDAALTCAL